MATVFLACSTTTAPADEVEKPRVKTFLSNADRVMADLEWIIVGLAGEKAQWQNNLFPALDVFLFGVDRERPIRFDILLGGEDPGAEKPGDYRYQPSIPIGRDGKDIKTFIEENLEPIGIEVKQKSRRGYYQLEGGVYEGWMRLVDGYGRIGKYESDVPKGLPSPVPGHKSLVEAGYDVAFELDNKPELTEMRRQAFDRFQANILDAAQAKDDESEAAFAMRKGSVTQQMERIGGVFVDAKRVTVGWTTDVDGNQGRADLYGEAFPDTNLASLIDLLGQEPSHFAVLEMPDDPTASLRVNLPFSEMRKRHLTEQYTLARPVAHEKIDANEQITTSEKAPAKQISDLFFDMLTAGIEVGRLDLYVDMTKSDSGEHVIIAAVRAQDGKQADEIVKLIPQAHKQWTVETDIETVGDTAIHGVNISEDLPQSVKDLFGPSGHVYVGTSPEVVWVCGGEGSLELLKETITKVDEAETPEEASPKFGEFKVHLHTLLNLYSNLVIEMGWNPLGTIEIKGPENPSRDGAGLQPIDPAEIREIATNAMANMDDRVSGVAQRVDNHAEGEMIVSPGVLRAVGKIVAKIAADNL